ncbi:MAG: TRAFAC class myosin-kinesin ATPase superfamily, partial [Paramarteilia canceri]
MVASEATSKSIIFAVGDDIKIKRSNGTKTNATVTKIEYNECQVSVVWKENQDVFTKTVLFSEVLSLNRPKKFVSSLDHKEKAYKPNFNQGDNQENKQINPDMNESFKPKTITNNNNNERCKSSASNCHQNSKDTQGNKIERTPPTNDLKSKTNLRRSLSTLNIESLTHKNSDSKRRESIAKKPQINQRANPRRSSLKPKNTAASSDSNLANQIRPNSKKPFQGKLATLKAAAFQAFKQLIEEEKENINVGEVRHHYKEKYGRLTVSARIRPLNDQELSGNNIDIISVIDGERLVVHEPKEKVDMTRYIDNNIFRFDYVFDMDINNEMIYKYTVQPLVNSLAHEGISTCFVYGQTGSGKTYTIYGDRSAGTPGLSNFAVYDIIEIAKTKEDPYADVYVGFFEIYGSKIHDLFNNKNILKIFEDSSGKSIIRGLQEVKIVEINDIIDMIIKGSKLRSSGKTSCNENSSRSHAVLHITIKERNKKQKEIGKFSLIDLAGNERGQDNINCDAATRLESSEINKNLLSLKECIRALDKGSDHVPFRQCILTKVLKDSFVGKNRKTCM